MRLAVFTNQFPGPVTTFFARDMRALLEAGIDLDIFPIYPLEPTLWRYVPDILSERVLPRSKVHHISLAQSLRSARPWPLRKVGIFLRDTAAISASTMTSGLIPLAKNAYLYVKALAWARQFPTDFDHVLAYWGSYVATCAYIFHRLIDRPIPFSIFLHAAMDLYENQVYLRQKLLYADNIITECEFNRRFISQLYPDIFDLISNKIHVNYLGIDFAEFPYKQDGRPSRKVLAVARLDKNKGFDYLLRAVHDLRCRGIDAEVELVGDGESAGSLRALANELRIEEKVRFRGWLPFHEVQTVMMQATMLVHPSYGLWDAAPNVIKESMALGTPVIASNVTGIPELLNYGRCGILVPPRDVTALANAIEALLTNDTLRLGYAHAGRRYAEEKFDLWRNGRRLADVLSSTQRREPTKPTCSR